MTDQSRPPDSLILGRRLSKLMRRAGLNSEKFSVEIDRPSDNRIDVTFHMASRDFSKALRVVKIIRRQVRGLAKAQPESGAVAL